MSAPPATSAPAVSAAHDEARWAAGSARLHWVFLIGSLALVGASLLLNARGEETVTLPILGTPLPPLCAMKGLAGWDCPGCGLTRSFVSLARGDFARAWHFNPAGWLIFAAILLQIPFRAVQLWRLRRGLRELDAPWLIVLAWLIVVALLGQWAARLFAAWM